MNGLAADIAEMTFMSHSLSFPRSSQAANTMAVQAPLTSVATSICVLFGSSAS